MFWQPHELGGIVGTEIRRDGIGSIGFTAAHASVVSPKTPGSDVLTVMAGDCAATSCP